MTTLPTSPGGTPERSEDNGQEEKDSRERSEYEFVTKEMLDDYYKRGRWDLLRVASYEVLAERDAFRRVAAMYNSHWLCAEKNYESNIGVDAEAKRLLQAREERTSSEKKGGKQ